MTLPILAIGDPHSKISNQAELRECADKCAAQARILKPKAILIMGDLANDHEKVYVVALNGMAYFMGRMVEVATELGIKVYYIVGNHDYCNNSQYLTEEHAFNVFKAWPSVVVVDKPTRFKTAEGTVILCPYVPPGRFNEAISPFMVDDVIAIFCHQEFLGAMLSSIPSKVGDKWDESGPFVVSGHIHEHGGPQANIRYVGAPFAHTFGDSNDKTISWFLFKRGEAPAEQRIDLGMPRKITVDVAIADAPDYQVPDNTHVRMNLFATTEEYAKFKKTEEYKKLNKLVKIVPQITDKQVVKANIERKTYVEILRQECQSESVLVQSACEEAMNDACEEVLNARKP
jgi:hypothetical protein